MTKAIYSDVPLPPDKRGGAPSGFSRRAAECPVGMSFFEPDKKSNNVQGYLWRLRKRGMKFAARNAVEDGISGVRIWRLS